MNIIITGFYDQVKNQVIEKLSHKVSIDTYLIVSSNTTMNPVANNLIYIEWSKARLGKYDETQMQLARPLDIEMIEKMKPFEPIAIKMMERIKGISGSYDNRKRLYYKHIRYWNYMLDTLKIDKYISSNVPHESFNYIIYCLCKLKGIKTLFFYPLPIRPYATTLLHPIYSIEEQGKEMGALFEQLIILYKNKSCQDIVLSKSLEHYVKDFIDNDMRYSFTGANLKRRKKSNYFNRGLYYFKNISITKIKSSLEFRRNKVSITSRERKLRNQYEELVEKVDFEKEFIYFPLHYQPEASTSPLAGPFVDQQLICEMLSYAVSSNTRIYVKEHPRISKNRRIEFYQDICSLPNVSLISSNEDTYKLIDKSIAVVTATGSAGWEAFLRGKNVLMFGRRFYQYAPGVYQIQTNKDLATALMEIQKKKSAISQLEIKVFLKAMEPFVFESAMNEKIEPISPIDRKKTVDNYVDCIESKITLNNDVTSESRPK